MEEHFLFYKQLVFVQYEQEGMPCIKDAAGPSAELIPTHYLSRAFQNVISTIISVNITDNVYTNMTFILHIFYYFLDKLGA